MDRTSPPAEGEPLASPSQLEEARLESLLLAFDDALSRDGASCADDGADPRAAELSDESAIKLKGMFEALRLLEQARCDGLADINLAAADHAEANLADETSAGHSPKGDTPLVRPSVAGQRVGRFELIVEIGRGGYGVVFLANDPQLGRQVALKIPRPEVTASEETKRRFLREARAAGVLQHPNLIPVYEVGEDGPFCYLATAFCQGPTLAAWLRQQCAPVSVTLAARLVLGLAQGVDHAHQRGVLHRDIKPSNILLDGAQATASSGSLVPRLTDFGLAKLMEAPEDETRSGTLVGTPAYMAPEQAEGRLRDVGPATDIYALGVVLYEMLANRPPFRGESDVHTLQLVSAGDVPPLRRLRRHVPRDLEAIVLRSLARDPARRYAAACDLAADLQRFLDGEPTLARPATPAARLFKAIRRRPTLAAMIATLVIAGALLDVGDRWYSQQLGSARAEVEASDLERRQFHYVADMTRAHQALSTDHIQVVHRLLAKWLPKPGEPDLRDFAWRYLSRQLNGQEKTLTGHTGDVYCVRYSRDGSRLASASADRTARIWNPVSGVCELVLKGHEDEVNSVAFSPDGAILATACDDGTAFVWNLKDGSLLHRLKARDRIVWGVAFSPDGKLLASCGADGHTLLYDTSTWQEVAALGEHSDSVGALAFSPDGKLLATASDDNLAIVWDVATRAVKHRLQHDAAVTSVAFDNNSKRLITGTRFTHTVQLWNLKTAKPLPLSSVHHEVIHGVSFSPTGEQYGLVTKEGVVELCDAHGTNVPNGTPVQRLYGHMERVWSLAYSPDGQQLATCSGDQTIKLWNLKRSNPYFTAESGSGAFVAAMTADGRRLAVGHHDGLMAVYDVPSRACVWKSLREFEVLGDFDGDQTRDSGYFAEGTWRLRLSSAGRAEDVRQFGTADHMPVVGDWNGDGTDDLGLFDPIDRRWTLQKSGETSTLNFGPVSRDSKRLIPMIGRWAGGQEDRVGLFSVGASGWIARFQRGDSEARMAIPNVDDTATLMSGRWLAGDPVQLAVHSPSGWWSHQVEFAPQATENLSLSQAPEFSEEVPPGIDAAALDAARDLSWTDGFRTRVAAIAISPDGNQIAAAHEHDQRLKLWDLRSGVRTVVLRVTGDSIAQVQYSADGGMLTVATNDGEITEFSADTNRVIRCFQATDGKLHDVVYAPDQQTLVTVCNPAVIKFWDADRKLVRTITDSVAQDILSVAFSADGKQMASCGHNRAVAIWDLAQNRQIAVLTGHTADVNWAAFSPDGHTLATASDDGSIRLWSLAMSQAEFTLFQSPQKAHRVLFTPNGQNLISVNMQIGHKAVQFWEAAPRD
jgi:WD40 repeat protein